MFRQLINITYGKVTSKKTSKLQQLKKQAASAKTRWIFLTKCLHHRVLPKSFASKPMVSNSTRAKNLTFEYNISMLRVSRDLTKQRYHDLLKQIQLINSELREILDDHDYDAVHQLTESSRESVYRAMSMRLKKKFDYLSGHKSKQYVCTIGTIKPAVLNLTDRNMTDAAMNLLNKGPKFVPAITKVPTLDIITSTEKAATQIERNSNVNDTCVEAERLRHEVSNILLKHVNKKLPSNLPREQRDALNELKNNDDMKIVPFDKGTGFAIMSKEDMLSKMKDHIGEAIVVDKDPTKLMMGKFQRAISKLKKHNKIDKHTFYKLYPSDAVPPRLYGYLKAHKPLKNYPMRPVVSTLGTPFYGSSKYLVELIQPTLNKNEICVKNSACFVEEAKTWDISTEETQVSYDVVNLYPSVPIGKAITAMMEMLTADFEDIKTRTNLTLLDIKQLLELCLQKCYFLWENKIYVIHDAGPIGLSLMVVVAEAYLQFLEKKALQDAVSLTCSPITYRRYVDDSHSRFENESQSDKFLEVLNSQDEKIQYTAEKEVTPGELAFLDVLIINDKTGKYKFKVYRKDAITNVQIKPKSSIDPAIVKGVFKGFIVRAKRICSQEYLHEEMEFLVSNFVENGYDEAVLRKIISEQDTARTQPDHDATKPMVKLPWIPVIGPQLRRSLRKHGCIVKFTSGRNLQNHLCQHKCPLPKNSAAGVYKLQCDCSSMYVGESKKRVITRLEEHKKDIFKGNWTNSGAAEHAKMCNREFKWEDASTVAVEEDYTRRKIREALEIRRLRRTDTSVLNRDSGTLLKSSQWDVLLGRMK